MPELNGAAPEVWVEVSAANAATIGAAEGDLLDVVSPRGAIRARLRLGELRPGTVFVPFHYGYWDTPEREKDRAANEATITDWDPASKQPLFKTAAARLTRIAGGQS